MNLLSLSEINRVLKKYRARYRWLDVFVSQVRELNEPSALHVASLGENQYRARLGADRLDFKVYPEKGVARFSLGQPRQQGGATGAATGAALGALIGATARPKHPEGMILGLLIGGLVGAALENQADQPNVNRIMTLKYDTVREQWNVYHGPYV